MRGCYFVSFSKNKFLEIKNFSVALGRRQSNLLSIKKSLQIYIPETLPGAKELSRKCEELYLDNVDVGQPREITKAFLRVSQNHLFFKLKT